MSESAKLNIPLIPKIKQRIPWESSNIIEQRKKLKAAAKRKTENPTRSNTKKHKSEQRKLQELYDIEQANYIQEKINQIQNTTDSNQSATAWKIVNEVSVRKSTKKAKLKANSQQERVKIWKENFKNLYGKPPKITENQTKKIINETLNIKTGNFTMDELDSALPNISFGKACGLDNIPPEVWKYGAFNHELLHFCNKVYNQEPIQRWTQGCILPFPKKGDLGLATNYRGITLTAIAAKIYNLLLLKRIRPAMEKILRPNQNGFRPKRSTVGQILTVRRLIEGVKAKNIKCVLTFVDFTKAFDTIHRGKLEEILLAYNIPSEVVSAIMMLYKNTTSLVRSPDGDTDFFEILAGVLQGDTLAPFLFIICLDYALRTSLDTNKHLGFKLKQAQSSRNPAKFITDVDYADDLALTSHTIQEATELLHKLETAAREIGLYINTKKTEYMEFNQTGTITSLDGRQLKSVQDFTYLGSSIQSTDKDMQIRKGKAWTALNKLEKIWKSNLSMKLKRNLFTAVVESVLLYGSTTWTLTKKQASQLDGTYTRMLRAVLNISWKKHPTRKLLYGNLPTVSHKIRDRRLRFAGHCYRNKSELASELLLWKPTYGKRSRGAPAKTYIDQLTADVGCSSEELPAMMLDKDLWRETVNSIRETLPTW